MLLSHCTLQFCFDKTYSFCLRMLTFRNTFSKYSFHTIKFTIKVEEIIKTINCHCNITSSSDLTLNECLIWMPSKYL